MSLKSWLYLFDGSKCSFFAMMTMYNITYYEYISKLMNYILLYVANKLWSMMFMYNFHKFLILSCYANNNY